MISNLAAGSRAFTSNAFLIPGDRTVLVDPGANFDVVGRLSEDVDRLDAVVLTHTHEDHVGNVPRVREAFDVDVWGFDPSHPAVDHPIDDGDRVDLGDDTYRALHTPGHKDDHLCLYAESEGILFAGDLIFQNGGFGRTDLPEGDRPTLLESIDRVHELVSPSLSELHPGHGPSVTTDAFSHVELAKRSARF
ncbi:MBL fold metallo-hydrolase [Natronorarus salvus]|uniref:MBL fold metallo-hydrolase n=1 Tax=Natronorarus salvus TaxID=3117733 RepID=UPI002F2678B7